MTDPNPDADPDDLVDDVDLDALQDTLTHRPDLVVDVQQQADGNWSWTVVDDGTGAQLAFGRDHASRPAARAAARRAADALP